ncbi:MAG: zeta toxin family protein [Candidatus Woesearchaeota archaeon]
MKIRILGAPGSGKSTYAKTLSKELNIVAYDLDEIKYYTPEYTRKEDKQVQQELKKILKKDAWILEGAFLIDFTQTYAEANKILYLDTPRIQSCLRVIKRQIRNKQPLKSLYALLKNTWKFKRRAQKTILNKNHPEHHKVQLIRQQHLKTQHSSQTPR